MSRVDGHWAMARPSGIVPPSTAALVKSEEMELAAKPELRTLKLKESLTMITKEGGGSGPDPGGGGPGVTPRQYPQ